MNTWNEGYFTDAAYSYGYYRELSPNFMRWCLLVKGFAAPEFTADSCHCELGYGQGLSANVHAAATPGKFFGTDFLPAHAAHAKELAEASGANAKFFEDSFEDFAKRYDLPQFDSIGLHGTWTWISAKNRRYIVDIARRHMKSGGVLYNSYNCLPGWAPNAPLRELLALCHSRQRGDANERIRLTLKFVGEMLDAEPAYVAFAPHFRALFGQVKNKKPSYIAHEYLNRDWDLMYFADVAEQLQEAKLDFATMAAPIDADTLHLTEKARHFLGNVDERIMREQLQDYFLNRQFRKDLYVRGLRRLSNAEVCEKLLSTRYVLLMPAADVPMVLNSALGQVTFPKEIYRPLLEFLEEDHFRPKTLREYMLRADMDLRTLGGSITILVEGNYVMPCQSDEAVKLVKKSCERLNAHICERSKFDDTINILASPLTGCGVNVKGVSQLFLAQYKGGIKTADKLAEAVHEIALQRAAYEERAETPEETLPHLKFLAERFLAQELSIFKALLIA